MNLKRFHIAFFVLSFLLSTAGYADHFTLVTLEFPPLEYEDANNRAQGFAVEIVRNVMHNLGHEVTIWVLPWTRSMEMVKEGSADAIFTAYKNPERETFLDYSNSVLISQTVYFYKKKGGSVGFNGNFGELQDKRIGVVSTISYGRIFDSQKESLQLERVNSLEYNFKMLLAGRIDLIPCNRFVGDFTIQQMGIADKIERLPHKVETIPSYIAFSKKKNLARLRDQFDKEFLKFKKSKKYFEIMKKYGIKMR